MALAIRSVTSFLSASALAGMILIGCGSSDDNDTGVISTGGAKSTTGGAKTTGGAAATGGSSAKATGGAVAITTGGANASGGASAVGGITSNVGGSTAGIGGATSTAGGATSNVGGSSSSGGSTSNLPPCSTTTNDAGPIDVCAPPDTFNPGNTGTGPNRDPINDPGFGDFNYHVWNGVIQLYGEAEAPVRIWRGSPFTDPICAGRGVDATGKSGIRLTLKNGSTTPLTLVLHVKDQAGDGPTYVTVPLRKSLDIAAGGPNAESVTIDVPFADFVAECATTVPFNAATIMEIGFGVGSTGTLDLTISSFAFY